MSKLAHVLLRVTAALAAPFGASAEELFGEPFPYGRLMYARPQISFRLTVRPKDPASLRVILDGAEVPAVYDAETMTLKHNVPLPLKPGKHTAQVSDADGPPYTWVFEVAPKALAELPSPDAAQKEALQAANQMRLQLKLPPLKMDSSLTAAAKLHAEYASKQKGGPLTHSQDENSPDFVGKDATRRAAAFGFQGACWENTCLTSSPKEAFAELIDAPYHRLAFLQPGDVQFGAGFVPLGDEAKGMWCGTFVLSDAGKEGAAIYPADGQREAPLTFRGNETPDPLRLHKAKAPTGYIVSFYYFSNEAGGVDIESATLMADGEEVECFLNTPKNDSELQAGVFLIPKKPLQPDTTYTAEVKAKTTKGLDISRTWSFRTTTGRKR